MRDPSSLPCVLPRAGPAEPPSAPMAATEAALEAFYFKPAKALLHAVELEAYRRAGVRLTAPVLDLGCGDGAVADLLRRCGVIGEPPACGLDIGAAAVRRARRRGAHRTIVRGDACRLPFPAASFNAVVANAVLCALPAPLHPALAETYRVLAPGGMLVASVPTARSRAYLWPSRATPFLPLRLRDRLIARAEERAEDRIVLELADWVRSFREAGLEVIAGVPHMGPRTTAACSLLGLQPLRAFSALRAVPHLGRRVAARLLERPIRAMMGADAATDRETAGCALIVARRS